MSLLKRLFQRRKFGALAIIGLDNAGKTTLVKQIVAGTFGGQYKPTIGVNVESAKIDGWNLAIWDLAGQRRFRDALWNNFMANANGIIFVVDMSDKLRIDEVKREFDLRIRSNYMFYEIPILIMGNKIDLPDVMSEDELIVALELNDPTKVPASYRLQPCSAKTGEGIYDGLKWLLEAIDSSKR